MIIMMSKAMLQLRFSSTAIRLLFLVTFVHVLVCSIDARVQLPPGVQVPAILIFGDSIVDPGNNNNIETIIKCNFRPYGVNFRGGMPTGRFCDGKIPSDLVAEGLGIKEFVPAYLDPALQPQDLITGVSFASGGSGYDPLTPTLASVLSMSDQLKSFKEYIGKLRGFVGENRTDFILANSLYLVVAGSDDIANTYFVLGARKEYDIPSYTELMSNSAANFVEELYRLGARRIGVFSAPPIGCVPSQRTLAGGLERDCSEKYNQAAMMFNSKLSANLNLLANSLSDSRIVYVDVYNPLADLIQNPQKYGFSVANKGCCGTGALEVAILCNKYTPVTCPNISDHVFWDSYHPTEGAYRTLINLLLKQYVSHFF